MAIPLRVYAYELVLLKQDQIIMIQKNKILIYLMKKSLQMKTLTMLKAN